MNGGSGPNQASAVQRDLYRAFLSLFGHLIGPLLAAQPHDVIGLMDQDVSGEVAVG